MSPVEQGTRVFSKPAPIKREGAGAGIARPGILPSGGVVAPDFPNSYPTLPCTQDPELFQPDGWGPSFEPQIQQAKTVCQRCPAFTECREWAITNAEPFGVWGATTPMERVLIRKRRGLPSVRGNRTGFFDEAGRRVG